MKIQDFWNISTATNHEETHKKSKSSWKPWPVYIELPAIQHMKNQNAQIKQNLSTFFRMGLKCSEEQTIGKNSCLLQYVKIYLDFLMGYGNVVWKMLFYVVPMGNMWNANWLNKFIKNRLVVLSNRM
jgi:hypothetical protein